jgi:lysyl-tRNA synthetase class 2
MTDESNQETEVRDENKLIAERREKLAGLREDGQAFPNAFRRDSLAADLQAQYGDKTKEELEELGIEVAVAGRIMLDRKMFKEIQDQSGRIQIWASKQVQKATRDWDLGDIVGVRGTLSKSGKGDLYVVMDEYQLLTKALRPLPEKHHGLVDKEQRYRQRYVDLIMNADTRETFKTRSRIVDTLRRYLVDAGFYEAETPMLQTIPGGAAAKPFITHHNSLDMDMYLRIAPELYLKRLVVGGFDRVFEINRNFRNEGLSPRHNPEFTMLEFYQAYADYQDLMDLTEEVLRYLAEVVLGTTKIEYQGTEYDLGGSFRRLTMLEAIREYTELSEAQLNDYDQARAAAEKLGIEVQPSWGLGKIQTEIFEATAEEKLEQPTFITEYPAEVSPLARPSDANPFVTERFELFVGGREIANGFSELNDPEEQAERFKQQAAEKDSGDDEAMFYDADYIVALEHGMPPAAGEGIGIDRLVMLFTDSPSIRDVVLFPHMRPRQD